MSKLKTLAICGIALMFTTGCHGLKGHLHNHIHGSSCDSCDSCQSCSTNTYYETVTECEGCDDDCIEEAEASQCGACEETLKSNLQLGMEQQLCFGALEVDMDKLKKLIDERQEAYKQEQKLYDEYAKAQKEHWQSERERQLRQYIDNLPAEGGTDCNGRKVSCCAPPACPKFELPSPPPRCIIGATEIPFSMPVTLKVGVNDVAIKAPRVCRSVTECVSGCDSGCFGRGCGNGCCEQGCGDECCGDEGCCDQGCCSSTGAGPAEHAPVDAAPPAPAAAYRRYPRQR